MDADNAVSQSIAAQLRGRIGEKKMPMKELAEATGIKLVSLSRYTNGKRDIPASSFALICRALDLDGGKVLEKALKEI